MYEKIYCALKFKKNKIEGIPFGLKWTVIREAGSINYADSSAFYSLKVVYEGQQYGFFEEHLSKEYSEQAFKSMWKIVT